MELPDFETDEELVEWFETADLSEYEFEELEHENLSDPQ